MASFDQTYAESGRQSELDALRRSGQYDAAKAVWEGGGSVGSDQTYINILKTLEGNTNDYIKKLTEVAQGNYDFTAKWIEANYKEALGTDDTKRAEFFKSVANDLEKQIGRIAYDQQTGSYRLTQNRDLALSRLKEEQAVLTRDLTTKKLLDQEQQDTSLNKRGLMDTGTRQNVQGLAQVDIGRLEQDYTNQFEALARAAGRSNQDINTTFNNGMEDLTTSSRRDAENAQTTNDQSLAQAQLDLENEKKRLEAQKLGLLQENTTIAQQAANLQKYGVA